MPTLDDLLSQTMLFAGARWKKLEPVAMPAGKGIALAPTPAPQSMADVGNDVDTQIETILSNAIWRFGWHPSAPATFSDVQIRTRGMGMDYGMDASVLERVQFRDVTITRERGAVHALPLEPDFMIGAWWTRVGKIPEGGLGLWKLETNLDSSMLVAFGFALGTSGIEPLGKDAVDELGEALMPGLFPKPSLSFCAGDPGEHFVCVGPCRYIVAVELVLCKERPDFVPGNLVGFARIQPHAFVWSNEDLEDVQVSIDLQRPAKGMECDPSMQPEIGSLIVADTNDEHGGSGELGIPIPYTDNLYDYYVTDPMGMIAARSSTERERPHDHPLQRVDEVTLADARYQRERFVEKAVTRNTPLLPRAYRDIRKCRRQGQFDNLHLAPRMKVEFEDTSVEPHRRVVLSDVVMINQCVHDCVHMHVRWGEPLTDQMMLGWGESGPMTAKGLPAVPPNQTVFASFPNAHGIVYRAVAQGVKQGHMQVFCHHGAAYAVDEWPLRVSKGKILLLWAFIRANANLFDEPYPGQLPFGWLEFYWRIRYTKPHGWVGKPLERLQFDLDACISCEEP